MAHGRRKTAASESKPQPQSGIPESGDAEGDQRLRTLVDDAPDFVEILDHSGIIRYISPAITRLGGYLPEEYPLAIYMRDWPVPPSYARVLAQDQRHRPALWQIGKCAFGFAGHPGLKVAMVEDLIMEFTEAPPDPALALDKLRAVQRALEDALVPIMTGIVRSTGWMQDTDRPHG